MSVGIRRVNGRINVPFFAYLDSKNGKQSRRRIQKLTALFYIYVKSYNNMIAQDELQHIKYPIGPFVAPENLSKKELTELISKVEATVTEYRKLVEKLSETDLKRTYREGAWSIQQLIHHVADMQLLHFFRMKKALTEPDYKEITLVDIPAWANTPDSTTSPVEDSLDMMESITKRFVALMRSLDEKQQQIAYYHPVRKMMLDQKQAIAMNAWHVQHHLEHIKIALKR